MLSTFQTIIYLKLKYPCLPKSLKLPHMERVNLHKRNLLHSSNKLARKMRCMIQFHTVRNCIPIISIQTTILATYQIYPLTIISMQR